MSGGRDYDHQDGDRRVCGAYRFTFRRTSACGRYTIVLRITDAQGAPLLATFGFTPEGEVQRGPFPTDAAGVGVIQGLADGTYRIRASAPGYLSVMDRPVSVSGGQTVEVPVRLDKGGVIRWEGVTGLGRPMVFSTSPTLSWGDSKGDSVQGLPTGDYKVVFFMQGTQPGTFKRGWYSGGGLLLSSAATVRVNAPETVTVQVPDGLPDLTELPALPSPSVSATAEGFTVTVEDPDALGWGLNYEVGFRKEGQPWQTTFVLDTETPVRLMKNTHFYGAPGDQFEFRSRVYQFGQWSSPTTGPVNQARLAMADGYEVSSGWSAPRRVGIPFAKPARAKRPAVWVEGRKRTLFWAPSANAVRYRVSAKRNSSKWRVLKPVWTTKTKIRLKPLKKGSWRFRVQANNPRASSKWSVKSAVFKVS
jgi:hypothetical protein